MEGELNAGAERLGYMMQYAHRLEQPGWAYTAIDQGEVLFCTGIVDMWPGTGEVWFIGSQEIHRKPRKVIEYCRAPCAAVPRRMTCGASRVCRAIGRELYGSQVFGFKNEGLMRRYGPEGRLLQGSVAPRWALKQHFSQQQPARRPGPWSISGRQAQQAAYNFNGQIDAATPRLLTSKLSRSSWQQISRPSSSAMTFSGCRTLPPRPTDITAGWLTLHPAQGCPGKRDRG